MPSSRSEWPVISVVMVTLNAQNQLALSIESALGQDYPAVELCIVDGGSWDGTTSVIDRYRSQVSRVHSFSDAGIYYAMNESLSVIGGDYVMFLNAGDTFYSGNALSRIFRQLSDNPDIIYGNHIYVDGRFEQFERSAPFDLIAAQLVTGVIDHDWRRSIPCHQATFVRTSLLREMRFDTRFLICADHEFLFRAHAAGASMAYIDETICHYLGGGYSMAMGDRTALECTHVYRRHSDRPTLVDKLFYPNGDAPFEAQTLRTGLRLSGFCASGSPGTTTDDDDLDGLWVSAGGSRLRSPTHRSYGLEIDAFNGGDARHIEALAGADVIGGIFAPSGKFRMGLDFSAPLAPSTIVTLKPEPEAGGHASSSIALKAFNFRATETDGKWQLAPGENISPQPITRARFLETLADGWWDPELDLVWSKGRDAYVWLKVTPETGSVTFQILGNPHVPDSVQHIDLLVNGAVVANAVSNHGAEIMLTIDCREPAWLTGHTNLVTIRAETVATPPESSLDTRTLGVGLRNIDAR